MQLCGNFAPIGCLTTDHEKFIAILTATACVVAGTAPAATYATEATITRQKEKGSYQVPVRVSRLEERNGTVTEGLLNQPKNNVFARRFGFPVFGIKATGFRLQKEGKC
jgi:hypothetical protein